MNGVARTSQSRFLSSLDRQRNTPLTSQWPRVSGMHFGEVSTQSSWFPWLLSHQTGFPGSPTCGGLLKSAGLPDNEISLGPRVRSGLGCSKRHIVVSPARFDEGYSIIGSKERTGSHLFINPRSLPPSRRTALCRYT